MKKTLILAACLLLTAAATKAQHIDTITPGKNALMVKQLTTGTKQYSVYFTSPARPKSINVSLWVRQIDRTVRNGQPVVVTTQHWYAADTNQYRHIVSVNRAANFAPVYHQETIGNKTKAYNWQAAAITGADTLAGNLAKDFSIKPDFAVFNWNLDIETFEMLPLAAGKTFAIPFYDAGTVPPAYVIYKVTGSEILTLYGNEKVDCWKLVEEGEFKGNKYTQTFWISKKTHELLKEEDAFNGGYRYKIKLPANAPNVAAMLKQ